MTRTHAAFATATDSLVAGQELGPQILAALGSGRVDAVIVNANVAAEQSMLDHIERVLHPDRMPTRKGAARGRWN